jgi:glutaredoxin 2
MIQEFVLYEHRLMCRRMKKLGLNTIRTTASTDNDEDDDSGGRMIGRRNKPVNVV